MRLEFERTMWREGRRAWKQVDRIQEAWKRATDVIAGLPEVVEPGRHQIRLRETTRPEFGEQLVRNVEFTWPGGTWAVYRSDIDESQDFGTQPFFPCPKWGWISWRGPALVVEADHSSCEFAEHGAFRLSIDIDARSIQARETWVQIARAVTEGPYVEANPESEWYSEDLQSTAGAAGRARQVSLPPSSTQRLRSRLGSAQADAGSLVRAAGRGEDLIIGLRDTAIDLETDRASRHRARFLVGDVPYDAAATIGYPTWLSFRISPIDHPSASGFEGWASFAARSPLLAGFQDEKGRASGWLEAPRPDRATDEDADDVAMSPVMLVAILRTLALTRQGESGRQWVFGADSRPF